jgi:hypothetical protein
MFLSNKVGLVHDNFWERKNLLYLHYAYETGEGVYDEKYHASGLINLAGPIRHV